MIPTTNKLTRAFDWLRSKLLLVFLAKQLVYRKLPLNFKILNLRSYFGRWNNDPTPHKTSTPQDFLTPQTFKVSYISSTLATGLSNNRIKSRLRATYPCSFVYVAFNLTLTPFILLFLREIR